MGLGIVGSRPIEPKAQDAKQIIIQWITEILHEPRYVIP